VIVLSDVHKRYWTRQGEPHWVLRGISLSFSPERNVGIIGVNGAGKSTLLRIIGGLDMPTRGEVRSSSRVSWPVAFSGAMQRQMTGRQNARFVCRVHGFEDEIEERIKFVHEFSELGAAFDEPMWTYSSGMRGRLNFSLSLAFEFDIYLVDEVMAVGDAGFRVKSQKAMRALAKKAGMIIVAHSESTIRQFCEAAVWLRDGKTHWYDSVNKALREYRQSVGA
jgi:capsular polysaccharide transport system ATP-binding protein